MLFWGLQAIALPIGSSSQEVGYEDLAASLQSNKQQGRARRKVADLDVTSGPVEYMKQLRSSLTNDDGSPTMERDDDPTNVWGIVDRGKTSCIHKYFLEFVPGYFSIVS